MGFCESFLPIHAQRALAKSPTLPSGKRNARTPSRREKARRKGKPLRPDTPTYPVAHSWLAIRRIKSEGSSDVGVEFYVSLVFIQSSPSKPDPHKQPDADLVFTADQRDQVAVVVIDELTAIVLPE